VHKNRLVIPFYDKDNTIVFYQSRTILNDELRFYPKYLSKVNSDKSLFNINNIDTALESIFIFEGPIDAFFVKNSVAVAGIQENSTNTFTKLQEEQISSFNLFKKIWVLDSQWNDMASRKKTKKLIDQGQTVFIWPEKMGKSFKDFNDYCVTKTLDSISTEFILENSFSGIKANLLMVEINRWKK